MIERGQVTMVALLTTPVLLLMVLFIADTANYVRSVEVVQQLAHNASRHAFQAGLVKSCVAGGPLVGCGDARAMACSTVTGDGTGAPYLDWVLINELADTTETQLVMDEILDASGKGLVTGRAMLDLKVVNEMGNEVGGSRSRGSLTVKATLTANRRTNRFTRLGQTVRVSATAVSVADGGATVGVLQVGYCGENP